MNDLFGQPTKINELRDRPYNQEECTVFNTTTGPWQRRRQQWLDLGIQSELGRGDQLTYSGNSVSINHYRVKEGKATSTTVRGTSIFDPNICELIYRWYCPPGGRILDPFSGGSVRDIVAGYMGYFYTGVDLSEQQIASNSEQASRIIPGSGGLMPSYRVGDSEAVLATYGRGFTADLVFSCPPYADLERYSDDPLDLSTMKYPVFMIKYRSIIRLACACLRPGGHACFIVGDVRDDKGYYYDFISDTCSAFTAAGLRLEESIILVNQVASAAMRAPGQMTKTRKLAKIHQNILIFKKCN